MSKKAMSALVAAQHAIKEQIEALRQHEAEQARDRAMRAVSIKAKNIRIGDLVEWGYGLGQQEVNGWGRDGSYVLLSTAHGWLWPLDADQRVKVLNRA